MVNWALRIEVARVVSRFRVCIMCRRFIESLDSSSYKLLPPLVTITSSRSQKSVVKFSKYIKKTRKFYDSWSVSFQFCGGHLTSQVIVSILDLKSITRINKVGFSNFQTKNILFIALWMRYWILHEHVLIYCTLIHVLLLVCSQRYLK